MIQSYVQVLNQTLDNALESDPRVFLLGEDIRNNGCFGVTKGLLDKYGPDRVVDMPMSEQSIVGLATGTAISGLRPVAEIMFMDFITLIYDQLFNHASTFSYLSNGLVSVPLVIRVPAGGNRGYGSTHSKTLPAPLMHIPGIKIVAPSNVRDVRGLLNAALKENNPVIFMEHKTLYNTKGETENAADFIPLGKANVVREGKDILLISYSKTVEDCKAAADILELEGISAEVLDLRTLKPLDIETIKNSLTKTRKAIVVEEGLPTCGVASEVIARIQEECFFSLDAPLKRICALDLPIPCTPRIEKLIFPNAEKIALECRKVCNG